METIKKYLDAMFANMPNTAEVRKAKAELLQMMEDKYNELISQGQTENTAVGTVISEFGNLDELADDLGLSREVEETRTGESEIQRRLVTMEESQQYLANRSKKSVFLSLGVMFCIVSVACPIFFGGYWGSGNIGTALMFISIAIGVGLIVFSNYIDSNWNFLKNEPCRIDMETADMVKERRRSFEPVRALCVSLGVILCIICWVPNVIVSGYIGALGPSLMFLLIGIGVFLIVYANKVYGGFDRLLNLNDVTTVSGSYAAENKRPIRYKNKAAETIATIYWPMIVSAYLIVSFLTFQWHLTWIIWPIAGVMHRVVMIYCQADEEY